MSPRKVKKEEKRREIALSCTDLIHEIGMKNITVAQVAKIAGIGKGTIYEYFENKEDIIFEIINIHIEEYHHAFLETIKDITNTREKVLRFFDFVTDNSEENMKHFNGYKEYLSIVLSEDDEKMKSFNNSCNIFFFNQLRLVLQEGIDNKDLIPEAINFCEPLLIFEKGIAIRKMTELEFNAKDACINHIDNLFDLIEIKKEK